MKSVSIQQSVGHPEGEGRNKKHRYGKLKSDSLNTDTILIMMMMMMIIRGRRRKTGFLSLLHPLHASQSTRSLRLSPGGPDH